MGLQRAAWALLVLASLAAAAIAGTVWPRLFDSTSDGVGKLVGARCEGAPAAGCTLSALEISPGRFWLEAHGPGATRIVVDFDLSSSDAAPRALLLAAASASSSLEMASPGTTVLSSVTFPTDASTMGSSPGHAWGWHGWASSPLSSSRGQGRPE